MSTVSSKFANSTVKQVRVVTVDGVQPLLPLEQVLRRRVLSESFGERGSSQRRRAGAIAMALVAVAVLSLRRLDYDSPIVMLVESLLCMLAVGGAVFAMRLGSSNLSVRRAEVCVVLIPKQSSLEPEALADYLGHKSASASGSVGSIQSAARLANINQWVVILVSSAIVLPWVVDRIARSIGFGNGFEIVMLSSLAWGGVSAAWVGNRSRTISLSVVCSGFLTLFVTFISESTLATVFAYVWGAICLWWLVANHWEQVESCVAIQVKPTKGKRMIVIALGCIAILSTTILVSNRIPVLRRLQTELMPTSGGTGDKDSAARSGVGNGDALIAARDHASTFGAVEADLFLDSEKPSLFDVFSEEFGEPRKTTRTEKAQALSPNETRSEEGKFAEANRSSGNDSFSTQRSTPRQRPVVNDLVSESLFFWSGQSGERLAVERFTEFDGVEWHNKNMAEGALQQLVEPQLVEVGDRTWFQPAGRQIQNSISPFVDAIPEAIKFTRFRSSVIPTRVGMQLWSIDQVTRTDFFGVSQDECLSMPDREHVPDYTVVRFVNSQIDLPRLEGLIKNCSPGQSHSELSDSCKSTIANLAHRFARKHERGLDQVLAVIDELRNRYTLERKAANSVERDGKDTTPIEQFLERRTGPSYLFATAGALMLEHLGYQTRLVTGFYANPLHYVSGENEIAVLPSDAHVWVEINAGHGYWIPLEPTPGFDKPLYSASLWYRLNKAKAAIAICLAIGLPLTLGTYFLRRCLFEIACRLAWPLVSLLDDRQQVSCLTRVLDQRLRLAGTPRQAGTIQRTVFLNPTRSLPQDQAVHIHRFFTESDRLCFGGAQRASPEGRAAIRHLWNALTVDSIRRRNRRLIRNDH